MRSSASSLKLICLAAVLTAAAMAVTTLGLRGPVTVGSFTFDLPDGWEQAPDSMVKSAGGWLFGYTKGVPEGAKPTIVTFLVENAPFKSEAERTGFLKRLSDGLKSKHGTSFKSDKVKLAGVETQRLRFVEDGETTFYLLPYNNERVFTILVTVPRPDAPFPPEASALLSTLKLAGPAYQPPKKVGFLDRLSADLDRLNKQLDDVIGTLGGDKKTETKPTDKTTGASKTDTTTATKPTDKADTRVGEAGTTTKPADTKPAPPTYIAVDASGKAVSVGLPDGDRVWVPPSVKPPTPLDKASVRLPQALDLGALAKTQYAGGAGVALAAMRELAGPLSPTDEAKLEAKWAPYLQMPPEGADEYFEKLAPILQETLALRTAAATAAAEFDAAWEEAVAAAEWDSEEDVREALAIADQQRAILVAIQSRLAELGQQAAQLGSPPNPIEARAKNAREHREAVKTVRDLLKPPPKLAGAWVLKRVTRTDKKPKDKTSSTTLATVMSDTQFRLSATAEYSSMMGGAQQRFTGEWLLDVRWGQPPALIAPETTTQLTFTFNRYRRGNDIGQLIDSVQHIGVASDAFLHPDPRERRIVSMYNPRWGFEKGQMLGIVPGIENVETGTKTIGFVAPVGEAGKTIRLTIGGEFNPKKDDYVQEGATEFFRVFEYVWTTDPNQIANAGKDVEEGPADANKKAKSEAKAFHEANVRIIQRNLERDREDLAKETDPQRRAMIEMRILQAETDLMAEQDLITSIETGQIVHRRTPFDDYAHDRFVQSIRENQVEMEQFQRATAALQRLARMLPPGEAEEARRFIDRQLAGGVLARMDTEAVQKIAHALNEKVQGYVEAERARANLDEAWAEANLETAQRLKSAADKGMFVCSIFGGRGVMMAYQAATGYVEGGPTEAVLRTAAWCGTPAYVASEAFRGYQRLDENGNPRGWLGAAQDAAKAYIFAKAFEYGASKARQWVTGRGPDGMTVAERQQLAEFQRARTQGELRAREFARAQADLERAARQGAAPEVITRLQNQCRRAAAAVHANPHAKNYLKFKGDFHAQRAYNAHMRANHAEVEGRFHEIMQRRGWNRQPLREFRNAASGDSVGMDHDIGLDEAAASALRLNGRPASVYQWQQDAQRAWDEAYGQVTGQSARRSWETVTTSVHAESYKDLNWLCNDKSQIQRAWGQQAADVTRYKNWHMLNDPTLGRYTALQEVSRGTAKDIGTKLQKLFDAARPASPQAAEALARSRRHWTKIQSILEAYGNNTIDPVYASRRIREVTGGKDIPEVVEAAAMMIESLSKNVGR